MFCNLNIPFFHHLLDLINLKNIRKDIYIDYQYIATLDICVHKFRAKAGEIPSGSLNTNVQ